MSERANVRMWESDVGALCTFFNSFCFTERSYSRRQSLLGSAAFLPSQLLSSTPRPARSMLALVVASNALVPQSLRAPQHSRLVGRRALVAMGPVMPDETWTETSSGLKYLDSATGEGEPPAQGSVVTVRYTGWTMDGSQFDSGSIDFAVGTGKVIA